MSKSLLAFGAAAMLGAASLTFTAAPAAAQYGYGWGPPGYVSPGWHGPRRHWHGHRHGWHGGPRHGWHGPRHGWHGPRYGWHAPRCRTFRVMTYYGPQWVRRCR